MGMSNAAIRTGVRRLPRALLAGCGGGGGGADADSEIAPLGGSADGASRALPTGRSPARNWQGRPFPRRRSACRPPAAAVTSAVVVAATGTGAAAIPEHCLVSGKISPIDTSAPDILFRLALPTHWNTKVVMFGGGGFNGTIPNVAGNVPAGPTDQLRPLGRGYATFASDSGHQANALGSLDGSFGLNDEAIRNWSGEALKKTRDAAVFLIKARYAKSIRKAYFAGGSTGGREALESITRWPDDWDGAISWYPAWKQASAILAGHAVSRALAKPGAYPASAAKRELLFNAAMEACDGLDGAMDGLINNQLRCNAIFDPATASVNGNPLRCPDGADTGDTCLSDAQITALKTLNSDTRFNFELASGEDSFPGYNMWGADLGITTRTSPLEPTITFLALGTSQPTLPMPSTAPYISKMTDQWIQYFITRSPGYDTFSFDPQNPGPWADRVSQLSTLMDVPVNLDAFAAKGGKLLLAHGTVDVLVSTRATSEYYERLQARMGPAEVRQVRPLLRSAGLWARGQLRLQRGVGFAHGTGELGRGGHRPRRAGRHRHRRRARPHAAAVRLSEVGAVQRHRRPEPRGVVHLRRARNGAADAASDPPGPDPRQRLFGHQRHLCLEGHPVREGAGGRLALEAAGGAGRVDHDQDRAAVRQCLRVSSAVSTARARTTSTTRPSAPPSDNPSARRTAST